MATSNRSIPLYGLTQGPLALPDWVPFVGAYHNPAEVSASIPDNCTKVLFLSFLTFPSNPRNFGLAG